MSISAALNTEATYPTRSDNAIVWGEHPRPNRQGLIPGSSPRPAVGLTTPAAVGQACDAWRCPRSRLPDSVCQGRHPLQATRSANARQRAPEDHTSLLPNAHLASEPVLTTRHPLPSLLSAINNHPLGFSLHRRPAAVRTALCPLQHGCRGLRHRPWFLPAARALLSHTYQVAGL